MGKTASLPDRGCERMRAEPGKKSFFDRFAEVSSDFVSQAPFFVFCVLMVLIWIPTLPLVGDFDTWQLLINTPTTVLTFLLVAILQNTQRRTEKAMQHKLDALADGLADLMEHFIEGDDLQKARDLEKDIKKLKETVGLGE
jgi:low affinity Fe/Cu permease